MKSKKTSGSKKQSGKKTEKAKKGTAEKAKNSPLRYPVRGSSEVEQSVVTRTVEGSTPSPAAINKSPLRYPLSAPAKVRESVTSPATETVISPDKTPDTKLPIPHLNAELVTVPAIPDPGHITGQSRVYVTCPHHASVQFRHGGFCEKCYEEDSQERMQKLDVALDEVVLSEIENIMRRIVKEDTPIEVVERFLGRIFTRFSRPQKHEVGGVVKALHLHAPVDFAQRRQT